MAERISAQAEAILQLLNAEPCHLSAEDIGVRLQGSSPATVYRSLERLSKLGLIRRVNCGGKSALWEAARTPHVHLVCRECGAVKDIPIDLTGIIRETVALSGVRVEGAEVTAHGLCAACAGKKQNPVPEREQ